MYNPFIFKIHKKNLILFFDTVQLILKEVMLYNKKEKCFFDFTIILYEMRFFYLFNTQLNCFINKEKEVNYFIHIYQVINNSINIFFNYIYKIILILNFIYLQKYQQNANI